METNVMRNTLLVLPLLLLFSPMFAAQNAGDAVTTAYTSSTTQMLTVTPGGVVTTVLSRAGTALPDGLAVAPANQGAIWAETIQSPRSIDILQLGGGGVVTTLAPLPTTFTRVPTLLVEQSGDILILNSSGTDRGVFRMPARGGAISTVAHNSTNANFTAPFAMEEDLITGDIIVLDLMNSFHRIDRAGKVTTLKYTLPPSSSLAPSANVHADVLTGMMYITYANYLFGFDPSNGATTTIIQSSTTNRTIFYGIDSDPYGGGYFLPVYNVSPAPTGRFLMRFDPVKRILTTVATLSTATVTLGDVISWESRMLGGMTRPIWGQDYSIFLSAPPEASQSYMAAAALGFQLGIPVGNNRRIPLDPDPLFYLSIQAPAVFVNFQGILDAKGSTTLTVKIPPFPQLAGLRFFLAAVTYDQGGIRIITEPLGVTIE